MQLYYASYLIILYICCVTYQCKLERGLKELAGR